MANACIQVHSLVIQLLSSKYFHKLLENSLDNLFLIFILNIGLLFIQTKSDDDTAAVVTVTDRIKSSKVDVLDIIPKINNQMTEFNQSETNLVPNTTQTDSHQIIITQKGRGHFPKRRKFLKHLYPFVMAALFAKLIVVPLVLKLLIATTSSAFVMSKIALVISALIALSWLLGATRERAKFQIVQYPGPGPNGLKKTFGGWNIQEKYSPSNPYQYGGSYNDWTYDDAVAEQNDNINDKNFFL
ncbi:uncharacterized protein LOC129914956 [Episyrphus balteatus]|uniref:uncharacterized protein LOC129914956 n=1 Tax=Episyrphus balteatus TaxID=286459 RepID=UPI002485D262|nr:uncharacterized protein LOC129914956 [Episyrphus balteatus]